MLIRYNTLASRLADSPRVKVAVDGLLAVLVGLAGLTITFIWLTEPL